MSVYISGSIAYDIIMSFPGLFEEHLLPEKLHIINLSFLVERMVERRGGTAGNVAYTLALLGQHPIVLATAGKDFARYKEAFLALGISLEGIREVEEELTATAFITTDKADNQIAGFAPAAMNFPCSYEFKHINSEKDFAIISPGNMEDMQKLPLFYKEKGIRYIYDPSQQIPRLSAEELLEGITGSFMLISNDYELELIVQATNRSKQELLELTDGITTTLGEQGCLFSQKGKDDIFVPAVRTEATDPTGAGDCLRGGLLWGLSHGHDMTKSLQVGIVTASFCVEHLGTQEHRFDLAKVMKRYENAFGKF